MAAKPPAEPKPSKKYLRIQAHHEGYRRAGIAHSTTPRVHELSAFTADQIAHLKKDRGLMVQEIGEAEAQDVALTAALVDADLLKTDEPTPGAGVDVDAAAAVSAREQGDGQLARGADASTLEAKGKARR